MTSRLGWPRAACCCCDALSIARRARWSGVIVAVVIIVVRSYYYDDINDSGIDVGVIVISRDDVSLGLLDDCLERPHGREEAEIVDSDGFSHCEANASTSCCGGCVSSGVVGLMCSE